MLFLVKNFNNCIVNNRRFYAIKKNKVTIIIWQPTAYAIYCILIMDEKVLVLCEK